MPHYLDLAAGNDGKAICISVLYSAFMLKKCKYEK